MQQAVVSNLQPVAASPAPRGSWLTRTSSPAVPRRGSARVRSTRNGSTESLDHLQRASKVRQQQQSSAPRRRVIQTTPFGGEYRLLFVSPSNFISCFINVSHVRL
ncbi:hypothetical protein PR202_ga11695 [Eleusine coracana subsp. coracana]|uniref:Uncharacterized protein n=1 Tax=Eleusine coracana subsp. coracana TaxID=191504 RepID=A0AAV5C9L5_ELECO|nr:hypothetical protein PR202_ga11695 [Eleusine coracana subsp. coracana]